MPDKDDFDVILDPEALDKKRQAIPEINWSSLDPDDYDLAFEDEVNDDDDDDISAEDLRKEIETLKKQNEELLKKSDSTSALKDSFQELAKSIQKTQQPVQIPEQRPKESDEDFFKRVNEGLFEGDAAGLLQEFYDRKMAPERNQQMMNNLYRSRKDVERDPKLAPIYQKYKADVEELIQQTPFETKRLMGDIYERAVKQVAQAHMDEIMDESMSDQVARKVKEELAKYGIDPEKGKSGKSPDTPIFSESNMARPSGGDKNKGPVKMRFTNKEKDFMKRKGMTKEALAELFVYRPEKREMIEKGLI